MQFIYSLYYFNKGIRICETNIEKFGLIEMIHTQIPTTYILSQLLHTIVFSLFMVVGCIQSTLNSID